MSYQLKNISDKDFGTIYELQSGKNLLGRSRSATIRILLDDISGKQCILHSNGLQVKLENLSRFGTRVNNSKVTDSVDLVEGDIITLGAKCKLILEKQSEDSLAIEKEMLLVGENDPVHDTVIEPLPEEQPNSSVFSSSNDNIGEVTETASSTTTDKKQVIEQTSDENLENEKIFLEEEILKEKTLTGSIEEDATAATRFIGDLPQANTLTSEVEEDVTAATRFVSDLPQENSFSADKEDDITAVTRFVSDLPQDNTLDREVEEDVTAATRFVSDLPQENSFSADKEDDVTAVTRFVSDLPQEEIRTSEEANDLTAVTRFASDISDDSKTQDALTDDHTAVTRFADELLTDDRQNPEDETAVTRFAENEDAVQSENSDADVTLTQFAADISAKPARRSLWQIIAGLFSHKKKPIEKNEKIITGNTDEFPDGTSSEDLTISSDDKNESQDIPVGILLSDDKSEDEANSDNADQETMETKVESTLHEDVTMVTAVTMATSCAENVPENAESDDEVSEQKTVEPDTDEDTINAAKSQDLTFADADSPTKDNIEESRIKADEKNTEGSTAASDATESTDAVKTRPLPIPVDLAVLSEDSESMEQLEEEIQQQRGSEEFFEEEDSGDKTNPDPDDIATFFEEEESDSTEKTNINETQMLQTRIASIDEINYIKDQVKRRQQKRFIVRAAVFASIAFALFVIWHLRAPQQESELSWPINKDSQKSIGTVVPFEQGWQDGGFDIFYPDCGQKTIVEKDGKKRLTVKTYIGKRIDTPLRINMTRFKDLQSLEESRKQSFARLLTVMMKNKKELYTFDKNSSIIFLGRHNGIMCNVISYQKDQDNKSYWGKLYFFKHGMFSYCLTAEVPFDDKNRAKQLLEDNNFIDISKRFEYLYWEGSGDFRRGDILTRIDEIEDDVRRKSPFQISNLERGIQSILIQASLDSNAKLKEKGLELLEKLRKNEDELYREYVGKWLLAKATDDTQLKQKIRNVSEGVFSLETDRRRNLILQDIWEYDK